MSQTVTPDSAFGAWCDAREARHGVPDPVACGARRVVAVALEAAWPGGSPVGSGRRGPRDRRLQRGDEVVHGCLAQVDHLGARARDDRHVGDADDV